MKFSDLSLEPTLYAAIEKQGFTECTPIQEEAITPLLNGKDVAGLAQTGTGKTAAFLIPLMERILRARPLPDTASAEEKELAAHRAFPDWKPQNFILVLVPTRELAEQVYENAKTLSEFSGLRSHPIYGGTGYDKQKEAIQNGLDFLVATPGRMIDLYKEHFIDLKQVRAIVFDEADRMFDMGFKDDMKYILQRVPQNRQFLVFSATLNFDVLNTAYQFGSEPIEINISRDQAKADNVKDAILHVGNDEKPQFLLSLFKVHQPKQAIVFTNFKHNVERVAQFLAANGLPAMAISSLLTQAQRNRVIEQFKAENEMNILVATDVAARGLDIKGVDLVINYDLPGDAESYVHRIGRTGRAGTEGKALSLVSEKDIDALKRVEDYLKNKIEITYIENDQMVTDFKNLQSDRPRRDFSGPRSGPERSGSDRRDQRGPRPQRKEGASAPARGPRPAGAQGGAVKRNEARPEGSAPRGEGGSARPEAAKHARKNSDQKAPRQHPNAPKPLGRKPILIKKAQLAQRQAQQATLSYKVVSFFKNLFK